MFAPAAVMARSRCTPAAVIAEDKRDLVVRMQFAPWLFGVRGLFFLKG